MKLDRKSLLILGGAAVALLGGCCLLGLIGAIFGDRATTVRNRLPTLTATTRATETFTPEPTAIETPTALPTETVLPTETFTPEPTAIPPTEAAAPEAPPATPLPPAPPSGPKVMIVAVNDGDEYVDIQNTGAAPQDLSGWRLVSERGPQDCPLAGVIQPGETLRIWALAAAASQGGFNCGFEENIWNNSEPDAAVLYDAAGVEVSRKD